MTQLIYRGVTHDAQPAATPRTPQALIYRGVAHNGMTASKAPARKSQRDMRYRGIRYVLAAAGAVASGAGTPSGPRLADFPA